MMSDDFRYFSVDYAFRESDEREVDGELLRQAFVVATEGTNDQLRAFVQLCAREGI